MKVVTVARKPLSESSVAANVLEHGCGAINVDASRVGAETVAARKGGFSDSPVYGASQRGVFGGQLGRWPANLILQHLPGCVLQGTVRVKSNGHYPASRPSGSQVSGPSGHKGQEGLQERHTKGESVAAWACAQGCPVAALDRDSGVTTSCRSTVVHGAYGGNSITGLLRGTSSPDNQYGDTGGASRFYKHVQSE